MVEVHTEQVVRPAYLAHWVVKTARTDAMVDWYGTVFGARVVQQDRTLTFLTWDEESHRLALVRVPSFVRHLFPLSRWRRKLYGVDHLAFTFASLTTLLKKWHQLRDAGIEPVWAINHGPTTSLYYEDPDGIRLEFQVENFATAQETAAYLRGTEFAANPIGVTIDPGYLHEQLTSGVPEHDLVARGTGTRPGTKARANRRAITWRTL